MIEAYRLVLTHYAVDEKTEERFKLEEPISVEQVYDRKYWEHGGTPIVLNKMFDEMRAYILLKADEVTEPSKDKCEDCIYRKEVQSKRHFDDDEAN